MHGIKVSERATSTVTPVSVDSALSLYVGTSPVAMVGGAVNVPVLAFNKAEAVAALGFADANKETGFFDFTLSEAIDAHFTLFGSGPIVLVNVLDPTRHKKTVSNETVTIANDQGKLAVLGAIKSTVVVTGKLLNTDYELEYDAAGYLVIFAKDGGSLVKGEIKVTYDVQDPSKVLETDITGGIDSKGVKTGLELTADIFPMFRKTLGQIVVPKYSMTPSVAAIMSAKANSVSGMFKAMSISDAAVEDYRKVAEWKNTNNIAKPNQILTWPYGKLGEKTYHMSTLLSALIGLVDSQNGGIPYVSPSNKNIGINGLVNKDGQTIWLDPVQSDEMLGKQGVVSALNFIGGWVAWGNRTAAYPANTDVKDAWISVRRMFNWIGNTIIQTMWQRLDHPLDRKQVEIVVDSLNLWINSLVAQGAILGGRVEFQPVDNPDSQLLDGKSVFRVYLAAPTPNEEMEFILEYDPSYFSTLFSD